MGSKWYDFFWEILASFGLWLFCKAKGWKHGREFEFKIL